ncbi:exodeoxyribonuclease VII large subunit [Endozoicomonas montiporae]|uniref:Exodeoxyribonuclease 7 large subunit n=1 Tax=Endozoicomonas montiporae CL-33 TaxID=570277 RepID=A0A142BBB5_9GAMM|nr:exodeoxyribonuclease VII large subunit [Endozoicomonas montiporae]AMO56041.1 exonuclease VII, large subunit [Endozoicomonas montiporae CL-33]
MRGQNLYNFSDDSFSQSSTHRPLTVTELNSRSRRMLETHFGNVRVEGELSALARPRSGHWYFTLKDANAQIRCAMFKNRNSGLKFSPTEGMQLLLRGRVSLYEGRGDYQLIVDHLEEAGAGALQRAFEALKTKLADEGLFSAERKREIPALPRHIGVVTSPTGAAIKDIVAVLKRRFPAIKITIIPAAVQGKGAAREIVDAITLANRMPNLDVLIVGRGGGSLEDLWPFNEEAVARAIAGSQLPVVSAIGHEIDFTIADFVADYRAPTPSAAAEILSPDRQEWLHKLDMLHRKLNIHIQHKLQSTSQSLDSISLRLRHPGERLREHHQRLNDLEIRLHQGMRISLQQQSGQAQQLQNRLFQQSPDRLLEQIRHRTEQASENLQHLVQQKLERRNHQLQQLSGHLNAVSPLATLSRGYSIVQKDEGIITTADSLKPGDQITARFSSGSAACTVDTLYPEISET